MTKEKTKKEVTPSKSMEGMKHGMKMSLVKTKNEYITATINGRYY